MGLLILHKCPSHLLRAHRVHPHSRQRMASQLESGMVGLAHYIVSTRLPKLVAVATVKGTGQHPNTRARASRIKAFTAITATPSETTVTHSATNTSKLIPAPTVIKNRPSNKPLNGSMLASNSCRNSLLAKTTPAKKAPKAGDRFTTLIRAAMPITSINAVAVKTSRSPDFTT